MRLRKGYAKATEKFIYSPCSLRVGATAVETARPHRREEGYGAHTISVRWHVCVTPASGIQH
jgi:hypothetical protein